GPSPRQITADEMGVMPPKGFHVRELREAAVAEIVGLKASTTHPKQCRRQRRVRVLILLNVACRSRNRQRHLARPSGVVRAQGFAVGEAQERSAIVNLGGKRWSAKILRLREQGKPPAESNAVGRIVQAQEVWSAVADRVGAVEHRA